MSVINTNIRALNAQATSTMVDRQLQTTTQRLSTGLRINSAKDDAAGLAISNRMTSQIRGFAVATRNANDGISMAQTAEGALGQVSDMLQRMRELAVQSGNGAMSTDDRKSLQLEVSQLKEQINSVATTTNHNNIKLLDGSAGKITLQTGVNAGETMKMGFDSVLAKDLGGAKRASLTSFGAKVAGTAANPNASPATVESYSAVTTGTTKSMDNGDLILNGVAVGASLATDDQLSTDFKDASAISKAAAINRLEDQTGVHATVGTTTAYGTTMADPAANSSGTMKINGWETASVALGTDKEVNRLLVANAINALSKQTGVVAVNTHDDVQGVVLQAADGRNISVAFGTSSSPAVSLTSAATGLSATGTFVGTYELSTKDNSPITVSSQTDKVVQNSGLAFGTFDANTASTTSMQRASAGAAATLADGPSTTTTGLLQGDTLVINGVGIDAAIGADDASTDSTSNSSTKASSAIAIAAAINKKSTLTGVTATAEPNVLRGTGFTAGVVGALNINGVDIAINTTESSNRDDVLTAINKFSGQTGVVASAWGAGVQLTAEDGRNISIGSDATQASALGLKDITIGADVTPETTITHFAQVTLHSDKQFDVKSGSGGNDNLALLGFRKGTYGGSDNGDKVADIDISTQAGATAALKTLDSAIGEVSSMQSRAGAYQNRLDAVVNNLSTTNQNMSASRSRILDTDYATETTNLAKSQIISQAATAMLAQANQSAQGVMSLLR